MAGTNKVYLGFFLFLFVCVAMVIVLYRQQEKSDKLSKIQTFQDCAAAGYPIMESYPRQCSLPNGKFFVETVTSQECRNFEDCGAGFGCINHLCQKLK